MNKRIKSISPVQFGIVLAALYALLTLVIFSPIIIIFSLIGASIHIPNASGANVAALPMAASIIIALLVPCLYAVFGFIFGVIGAIIYNIVASMTGGVEFTVIEVS